MRAWRADDIEANDLIAATTGEPADIAEATRQLLVAL